MKTKERLNSLSRIMVALGGLGALLVVALRVWIVPAQRDIDTGLFTSNTLVIGLMLALLAALGAVVPNLVQGASGVIVAAVLLPLMDRVRRMMR